MGLRASSSWVRVAWGQRAGAKDRPDPAGASCGKPRGVRWAAHTSATCCDRFLRLGAPLRGGGPRRRRSDSWAPLQLEDLLLGIADPCAMWPDQPSSRQLGPDRSRSAHLGEIRMTGVGGGGPALYKKSSGRKWLRCRAPATTGLVIRRRSAAAASCRRLAFPYCAPRLLLHERHAGTQLLTSFRSPPASMGMR